jgi:predicted DsbA family dithiol-disulfide isomerase
MVAGKMSETSPTLLPRVAVDIWSDVVCPWCAIGYTQFAKALKELDGEIEV